MSRLSSRQQELIAAAVRLLDRKGIEGFTMRSLAAEVGMSAMAAYKHFENQHALQLELWRWCVQDFKKRLEKKVINAKNGNEAILLLGHLFIEYTIDVPQRARLLFLSSFIQDVWKDQASDLINAKTWGFAFSLFVRGYDDESVRQDLMPEALFASVYAQLIGTSVLILSGRYQHRAGTPNNVLHKNAIARISELIDMR